MAKDKKKRQLKENAIEFDLQIVDPKEFTKANIGLMTENISKAIALEAANLLELGVPTDGFHIRLGGGHSRTFSKTSDHKNVIHGRTGGTGSGSFP